ncbi:uncharacterized protein KQ657_003825 [Scheffersomyces spartinae]|uniref:Major facilitator superfamily (MFS) profile domain-containing protein n=1 Tax=Scheffersomyces spartinae TaxID=45513 RepID=A0A9P8AJW8_9ASCO|nr:uncharacterized protein KQ657_003825 [Scheffersomyces spartinae]KAG7195299.1 hypothetical protein KQ657_003825 [Scheffersomyces spartinae]
MSNSTTDGYQDSPYEFRGYEDSDSDSSSIESGFEKPRKGSISSVASFGASSAPYSVRDIYGDLNSNEIALQREYTRRTIVEELIDRSKEAEAELDFKTPEFDCGTHDLEKGLEIDLDAPETSIPVPNNGEEFKCIDPELINWNETDDPQNPRNWSSNSKAFMLALVSLYALVAPMSSSILSPAMSNINQEFGIDSQVLSSMVVSIQILAWALGPLLIAPLSEHDIFGRKLVLDVCCWMSLVFNIGCGFSQTTVQMMVCRFIGGLFGCVPLNVCAGVISDLYNAKQRNIALAGYSFVPLLGPDIAPLIAGFVVDNTSTWRWVFYVLCIFNATVAIVTTLFFKETYAPTLLRRKCLKLQKETGNTCLHTIYDITDNEPFWTKMWITLTRPLILLFTHPMIVGLGSFMAFTYGFMYLMIVTFPRIFTIQYGYSKSVTGLMYIPMGVGFALGVIVWTILLGKVYDKLTESNGGVAKPEFRLPCLFVSSVCIPIGLIWFGWSAQYKLHWIMPGIGLAIFAFGLVCVFQLLQSYLIDMNVRYAASSVAAAALFRLLFGFLFPLFAGKMYASMGYGWGNTMSAIIGLFLGVPFPIFAYKYGERIRHWANKRIEAKQLQRDQRMLRRQMENKNKAEN